MDKQPKIIKRQKHQRGRIVEPHTDSVATSESSFVEADEPIESAEPAVLEQLIESVEPHLPTKSLPAIGRQPFPYHPAVFQWKEELREIRYESDSDVWDSCPYD